MWKVENEMASLTEDEMEICNESVGGSVDTVGPSDPSYKNNDKKFFLKGCASANR